MTKLLDEEGFGQYLEAATRRAGVTVEKRDGLILHVVQHGQAHRCKLQMAWSAYQQAPDRLEEIVQSHLRALKAVPPPPPMPTEKEAAESFLPMLQQEQWATQATQATPLPPIYRPFVAGLVIAYIFDFPTHRAYVNRQMVASLLQDGKESEDALHEYALENLRRRVAKLKFQTHGWHNQILVNCETHEGFAATSILLPELLEKWAKKIPGRMLIGIPNRDFLILFSDRHPSGVAPLARQVRTDAGQRPHPLSPHLLTWENGQVRLYQRLH